MSEETNVLSPFENNSKAFFLKRALSACLVCKRTVNRSPNAMQVLVTLNRLRSQTQLICRRSRFIDYRHRCRWYYEYIKPVLFVMVTIGMPSTTHRRPWFYSNLGEISEFACLSLKIRSL